MNFQRLVLSMTILLFSWTAFGQITSSSWSVKDLNSIDASSEKLIVPQKYLALDLNINQLRNQISNLGRGQDNSWNFDVPLPDGTFERFSVRRNNVIPQELLAKYPGINTFTGTSLSQPDRKIYMDVTHFGFHGMIRGGGPSVYIDPFIRDNDRTYVSYYRKDFKRSDQPQWSCSFENHKSDVVIDPEKVGDREIKFERRHKAALMTKEYRLAVAVTGQYTGLFGGTVAGGLAAVVTAINRVTGVYETEVGVSLSLIPDNDKIIYTDPTTDPFTNSSGDLNRVQNVIDTAIGSANYDVGHVFTSSSGGVASLGVVCNNSSKARGLTGLPNPTGDPFYIDYVAHEMGHQFAGLHTFNGDSSSCSGGNRSESAAYEPGSGATIMAYAGICGNDNLQSNSDAYFHLKTLMQITDHVNGSAASCATLIDNGNNMPTSDADSEGIDGKTIPASTPFELTGDGGDVDADDLTYQWDEWDLGPQQDVNAGDNGSSPIFRSFFATDSKTRVFQRLSDLLENTTVVGETLPTTNRTLDFQFIVRDNVGGWMNDMITLNVAAAAGPFLVTSFNTPQTLSGDITVTWDVAGTTSNGVNCGTVDISLSTDGGLTFGTALASGIPNNGSAMVTLPETFSATVRIKIKCANNVFFDINNANLVIEPTAIPCNTVANIPDDPIADGIYSSNTELTSTGKVPAGGSVIFTGETGLSLITPFTIVETANFEARVTDCDE